MRHYDAIVIGGGIHGAGMAQAFAAAGYSIALFEQYAPAAGTSQRSSKLIHGGLRYLETGQFRLVRESLHERELLLQLAPDLVHLVPFLIPVYQHTRRRPWQISTGLFLYQVLTAFRPSGRFHVVRQQDWQGLAGLRRSGLQKVFSYFDAQTDDAALTAAVLASAQSLGAEVFYPAKFAAAERTDGGYRVAVQHAGHGEDYTCSILINAGGPWVNDVQDKIRPLPPRIDVQLVQGTHLEFDEPIGTSVFYVEAPRDQRAVFVIPWKGGTMVGTTETPFIGRPEDVAPLREEIDYLQETLLAYFPDYRGRLRSSWAGLRVLPVGRQSPFSRSRETRFVEDTPGRPHLIAIYGGKLTAYRATAERVLALACHTLPARERRALTERIPLPRGLQPD